MIRLLFDDRVIFEQPFFLAIESLWDRINARNGRFHIQQGPYIYDIPYLNEEVVRESIHNAIVHRDYRRQSEIVIKQSNYQLEIINPGGFPLGVSLDNLLIVNSTPRNRLLADIMLKTGIVERSGQGIDKLFINSIFEAKGTPDYSRSDNFQVYLSLPTVVQDKAFVLFLEHIRNTAQITLSLREVITLEKIRTKTEKNQLDRDALKSLLEKGLIESIGKTNTTGYILSREYYTFTNQPATYTKEKGPDISMIWLQVHNHLSQFNSAKIGDFEELFKGILNREQVKYNIYLLVEAEVLDRQGKGRGTTYSIHPSIQTGNSLQLGASKLKDSPQQP